MQNIDLRFTTLKESLPSFIYDSIANYVKDSNSYFYQPEQLRKQLADKHGVPVEMIYLTAGADQALNVLTCVFGQQTHVFTPTYVGYSDAQKFGHELHEHYSLTENTYQISTDHIEGASLVFLANPNNPAGLTSRDDVLRLVHNNPDAKVVVDEAYGDFANESVVDCVQANANLVVVRSFSKGYSLAGFRIGYIIAHPDILQALVFETMYFNVAYPSVGAAVAALSNESYFSDIRGQINQERQRTESFLSEAGYVVVFGHINAALIRFQNMELATAFRERLKAKGILVNQGNGASNFGLDDMFVRLSIGTNAQMELFRAALL